MKKIEAFEVCYQFMSWTGRIINRNVLEKIYKKYEVLIVINRKKLEYLGHAMRGPKYASIIQGEIKGKINVGI